MKSPVVPSRAAGRRAAHRAETVAQIRARAREVIAEHGPGGLSLRAVGADLGMAPSGVHYYFASRDELLASVVAEVFHELASTVRAATDHADAGQADPVQAWLAGVRVYARWAAANPELWLLAHSRTATRLKGAPELLPAKDAAVRALMSPLRPVLAGLAAVPVDGTLAAHLGAWARAIGEAPAPSRQLVEVHLYTLVQGHVQLTVTGSLPRELLTDDTLLEAQLQLALRGLGLREDDADAAAVPT